MKNMMKKIVLGAALVTLWGVRAAVPADAVLADFPRLAGETDDAPRFRRAIAAAPNGVLAVGKGDYAIVVCGRQRLRSLR